MSFIEEAMAALRPGDPYRAGALVYRAAGWRGVLPVTAPAPAKAPMPVGYTGREGRWPSDEDVAQWRESHSAGNLALRLPAGLVGIDVDAYDAKPGAATLAELESALGSLPETWRSSARPWPSGIRFYGVSEDVELVGALPGMELIQFHHRYALVWPSQHAQGLYRWWEPGDEPATGVPGPGDMAALPAAWCAALDSQAVAAAAADYPPAAEHREAVWAAPVERAYREAMGRLASSGLARHDVAVRASAALARHEQLGYAGATAALDALKATFLAAVAASPDRDGDPAAEWQRMLDGARHLVRITAATAPTAAQLDRARAMVSDLFDRQRAAPGSNGDIPAVVDNPDADLEAELVRVAPGGDWVLDTPATVPAVWGRDQDVLWAEGESLFICGPAGVGKTTLEAQLVYARLGLTGDVLGLPVRPSTRRVLWLAMDRPRQIQRAIARLAKPEHRDVLNDLLRVRPGPPVRQLVDRPDMLVKLAQAVGADTVFLDSLKDAAIKLTDDEVGGLVNRALQTALAEGIEVAVLHHQRKSGREGGKPRKLEDVYGSTWLVNGAGSVVLLWGEPGDQLVELSHLKQPAEVVGPLKVAHDHAAGNSRVERGFDPRAFLNKRPQGVTAQAAARARFNRTNPTDNQQKIARRQLEGLVRQGLAIREDPVMGGPGGSEAAVYRPVGSLSAIQVEDSP